MVLRRTSSSGNSLDWFLGSSPSPLTFTLHQFLNRWSRWGTTDDFTTSFLHFSLFSSVLWDLANSRPVHSLMLSSYLFFCLPRLLNHFTVACKMVWSDLMNGRHVHTTSVCISLRLSGRLRVDQLPAGSWHRLRR